MKKRRIGILEVTVVGIGCNNFSRQVDAQQAHRILQTALDEGVNFFDTADHYGRPRTGSESLIGEFVATIGSRRDQMIIATKFGRVLDDRRQGAKAAYVKSATEDALKRLRTDRIDLMQLHVPDPNTPIAETLGALSDLMAQGKIREIGASNFNAAELRQSAVAAKALKVRGFASTQAEYSVLNRKAETELLPACGQLGTALLPYLPLYNGLLTGRYKAGEPPPAGSRIAGKNPQDQSTIFSERNFRIVAELTAYAQRRGHTLIELAFAWLLSRPSVPSIIAGVSSPEQVKSNVAAASWELTPDEVADIERLAPLDESTQDQVIRH